MQTAERYIEIDAPVERVFDFFSEFENLPRWMDHIKRVDMRGRRYSHWVVDAPFGREVEWDAETTIFQQDRRIAWRSVRGDIETQGEVTFERTNRNTTLMHVNLGYDPPAGRLGALVARLFGNDPERQLAEDLSRFKRIVEGDWARNADRSETRRRYERTAETVPDLYDERRAYTRDRYDEAARPESRADYRDRAERWPERERVRRERDIDEHDYRSGQIDPIGGYVMSDEEPSDNRLRAERTIDYREREARRRPVPLTARPEHYAEDRYGREDRLTRPAHRRDRYEAERTSAEVRADRIQRRGVDRLLDEPPSSRWRK